MPGKFIFGPLGGVRGSKMSFLQATGQGLLDGVLREPALFHVILCAYEKPSLPRVLTYFQKFGETLRAQPKKNSIPLPNLIYYK